MARYISESRSIQGPGGVIGARHNVGRPFSRSSQLGSNKRETRQNTRISETQCHRNLTENHSRGRMNATASHSDSLPYLNAPQPIASEDETVNC